MIGLKREQAMPKGGEYEKDGIDDRGDLALHLVYRLCGGEWRGVLQPVSFLQGLLSSH
jgi:hypothetical protein